MQNLKAKSAASARTILLLQYYVTTRMHADYMILYALSINIPVDHVYYTGNYHTSYHVVNNNNNY